MGTYFNITEIQLLVSSIKILTLQCASLKIHLQKPEGWERAGCWPQEQGSSTPHSCIQLHLRHPQQACKPLGRSLARGHREANQHCRHP